MCRMFGFVAFATFCLVGSLGFAQEQATFYVAPTGSDSNPGTEAAPFKTITKAQKAVREINGTMTGDIVVYLREGTYQLNSTVNFDERDGGKDGHYVRYKAYKGENPLITGGKPITGWTIHDEANNIWKAEGVDGLFRQMYVNGKKAIRARFPNLKSNGDHNFFRLNKVDSAGSAFLLNNSDIGETNWKNQNKIEIHLMIAWAESILRLDSIQGRGNVSRYVPQQPERGKLFRRKYPMLGTAFMSDPPKQQVYYLENAYEFIDAPGEWYLDETTGTVYYKAREGENMGTANVVAPNINTLFSILGKDTKTKVGYMEFDGLHFAHSNYLRPSEEGFLDLQAGMFNIEVMEENGRLGSNKFLLWRPDAGFRVENAHHMKIRNCTFTQMAANGLDMVSGTNDDLVEGNVFYEIGANGIMLGKFSQDSLTEIHIPYNPTDKDEISTRDTLRYNLITNVTNEHQGAVGIGAGYPRYVVIENNEVSYTNYSGISVGYGWTKSETAMTNNKINKNNIHHISRLLCDSGPIYTLSNQGTGSEIKENYLHDYGASEWSDYWVLPIYLDEGSSGFTVENNSYKNSPSGVGQNQPGQFTQRNNGGYIESVAAAAGLQGEFKNLADKISSIPLADFSNPVPQAPFKNAFVFPALVQAEDYDEGGQGVSYSDKDIANQGNAYREDGVDVVGLECTDSAATQGCKGYAVGYTQAGEWMEYSVNVPADAKYFVKANVATASETSSFMLLVDNNAVTDTVAVPKTDSTWDVYKEIDVGAVELKQGEHVIRLLITGDYLNIDWIQFADSANQTLPPTQWVEKVRLDVGPETAYDVFGLTGKYLGRVELRGESVRNALVREGFAQGIYLVRGAKHAKALRVQVK
jgi:Carbohydrate binding module (family 6)./Protein of unknown function (DUF1565).